MEKNKDDQTIVRVGAVVRSKHIWVNVPTRQIAGSQMAAQVSCEILWQS